MESPISIQDLTVESSLLTPESLMSMERLDRASPELWPEQVPGIQEYPSRSNRAKVPDWMGEFNAEDRKLLNGLTKMSAPGLVSEVKKLFDAAYQLGCDESKEMTRGMYLNVLQKKDQNGKDNTTTTTATTTSNSTAAAASTKKL